MTKPIVYRFDPALDLLLERVVDVPKDLVWAAWTTSEHVKEWFTPAPWETVDCEIDLRPGGIFRTVMRSPEGQDFPKLGCYLEVIEGERLVWTDALEPGFRPAREVPDQSHRCGFTAFTAVITLAAVGNRTRYSALAMHKSAEERKAHEALGFHAGWGTALDQLVAFAKTIKPAAAKLGSTR